MALRFIPFSLLTLSPLFAQISEELTQQQVALDIDWSRMTLRLEVSMGVAGFTPSTRNRAIKRINRTTSSWIPAGLGPFQIDSRHRFSDIWDIESTEPLPVTSEQINGALGRGVSAYSEQMDRITAEYTLGLIPDLIDFWINEHDTDPLPDQPGYYPTTDYTGVVIYAMGNFPIHGEDREAELEPSLLPRIFDEDMRLILEYRRVESAFLRRWGVVGYRNEVQEFYNDERVGAFPLRVVAREFFGAYPTDIVLPMDAVNELLATENNRRLLREGRVLIICGNTTYRVEGNF